ncbi:MAG: hypothetical protein AB202_00660 [Parcubacteria bacterium C7867-007]|nr:MAG: hypothetical protein AB202_00660 [Parcubacteria bacterium C7867-007]
MERRLSLSLKLLALFFFWYTVVFILSVLPLLGIGLPSLIQPSFRGVAYVWDFELFFTVIYFVWGIYLWKASRTPQQHKLFIDFTLWATFAHILAMFAVGFIRTEDFGHLVIDGVALAIPLALVTIFRYRHG